MRIAAFPAGVLRTNCYLVASDEAAECIIIDPGQHSYRKARDLIAAHNLRPVGIYLTHGHADHIWNAPELSDAYQIPVTVHANDVFMVENPAAGVGKALATLFPFTGWTPPSRLTTYTEGEFRVAGLTVTVLPLPGHTPGGVGLLVSDGSAAPPVLFSGDTLFKGAVGRTDLPGGDAATLLASIERHLIPLPGEVVVAPGHGDTSTLAAERATNVYLHRFRGNSDNAE